jgi:rubrerythrin
MKEPIQNHIQKFDYNNSIFEKRQDNKPITHVLNNGISNKLQTIKFYEKLIKLAPSTYENNQLKEILKEERNHLQAFKTLYAKLTDQDIINDKLDSVFFRTYRDGLLKAYENELSAYELYRDAFLIENNNKEIHDCFFKVMTDELKHANRFMFLYFRDNL